MARRPRFVAVLLLSTATAVAQEAGAIGVMVRPGAPPPPPPPTQGIPVQPAASPDAPPEKKGTMSGQIVAITGEPLNKAEVTIRRTDARPGQSFNMPPQGVSATTDATGAFTLKDVEPGTYMLTAQRTGYVQQAYGARGPMRSGTMLKLSPGQELKGLVVKLTKQAVITGKVTDDEGEPMQGGVQAMSLRYYRGKKQLMPVGFGQANDLGEYRIANLFPGKYIIMVSQQRMGMPGAPQQAPKDGPEEGFTAMYYPGVFDPAQAVQVDVAAGAEMRSIDIRMKKTKVVRIKGKVIDGTTGKPAEQVMVMLMPASMGFGFMSRSMAQVRGSDGSFELSGVSPGSYSVVVNKMNPGGGVPLTSVMKVDVGDTGLEGLNVVLNPPFEVPGTIRLDGKTSEPPKFATMRIGLEALEGLPMGAPNAGVSEDGSFKLTNTSAGKFRIHTFNPPEGTYVKSIRVGNQEIGSAGLDLTGGSPGALEIILSPRAATVNGSVIDPKQRPVPGVSVVLLPTDPAKREDATYTKMATTDQTGAFQIKAIPPGEYLLLSWEDVEPGAWQDPEFVKPYETQAIKLKLAESANENVQSKVILAENSTLDKDDPAAR